MRAAFLLVQTKAHVGKLRKREVPVVSMHAVKAAALDPLQYRRMQKLVSDPEKQQPPRFRGGDLQTVVLRLL